MAMVRHFSNPWFVAHVDAAAAAAAAAAAVVE